jgi:hypothetical protein
MQHFYSSAKGLHLLMLLKQGLAPIIKINQLLPT